MAGKRKRNRWLLPLFALSVGTFLALVTSLPKSADLSDGEGRSRVVPRRLRTNNPEPVTTAWRGPAKVTQKRKKLFSVNQPKNSSVDIKSETALSRHPYRYVLTPDGVCKRQTLIVVFVHSAPWRSLRRDIIRTSWGNATFHDRHKLVVIFAIGSSTDSRTTRAIRNEHALHRDILSEDFIDNYRNLTHKTVGALKWIVNKCKKAKFIIKTDDDTLVNVFAVLRHLSDLDRTDQTSGLLMCRYMGGVPVLRTGKWAVSSREYPGSIYPPYCSGLAYIMSMDVARSLYGAAYRTPILWVDDVWFTGLVARNAGVKLTNIGQVYSLDKALTERKFLGSEWYQYMFAHLAPKAFRTIWPKIVSLAEKQDIPKSSRVIPGFVVKR